MVVRDTWCALCEERCTNHPTICATCSSNLIALPAPTPQFMVELFPMAAMMMAQQIPMDPRLVYAWEATRAIFAQIQTNQSRIAAMETEEALVRAELEEARQEWEQASALSATDSGITRPVSMKYLAEIPRTVLDKDSACSKTGRLVGALYSSATKNNPQAPPIVLSIEVVVPGELGCTDRVQLEDAAIVLPQSNWTKVRGSLDPTTVQTIAELRVTPQKLQRPVFVFDQHGDGVSFRQKALQAQAAGAQAMIIGNHVAEPWPYIMKDRCVGTPTSNDDSTKSDPPLTIPVVMLQQADAQELAKYTQEALSTLGDVAMRTTWNLELPSALDAGNDENEEEPCAVCTEPWRIGQTIWRLPGCGHVFHEACAHQWLGSHNTCPTCRREFPTDDAAYDAERQRVQRTHAGSRGNNNSPLETNGDASMADRA